MFRLPDFDGSSTYGPPDGDAICANFGSPSSIHDLNGDLLTNIKDLDAFLKFAGTRAGDIDLNGDVAFGDFLLLSAAYGMENPTWSSGDHNCNGSVDFGDFLTLSANFGQSGPIVNAVPEPDSCWMLLSMIGGLAMNRQGMRRRF